MRRGGGLGNFYIPVLSGLDVDEVVPMLHMTVLL